MALTTQTTTATFIQEIWSKILVNTREENLVWGALVDRRFEQEVSGVPTDLIHVQGIDNFGAATQYSAGDDPLTFEAGQINSQINIAINRHFYKGFAVTHDSDMLANVSLFNVFAEKAGYAVALELDTFVNSFVDAWSGGTGVGALGVPLTTDDIIEAVRELDDALAPRSERFFVFSAIQDAEFKKEDKLINADYTSAIGTHSTGSNTGPVQNIYGLDWWTTTNVEGSNAAGHDNGIFHREVMALVVKENMRIEGPSYDLESDTDEYMVHSFYGGLEIRDNHGVPAFGL